MREDIFEERIYRPDRKSRAVRLCLIGAAIDFAGLDEALIVLRHRYVLAHYFGFLVVANLAIYMLDLTEAPVDVLLPATVLGLTGLVLSLLAYIAVAARIVGRIAPGRRVWMTPGIMMSSCVMVWVAHEVQSAVLPAHHHGAIPLYFWLTVFVIAEVCAVVIFRGPVPRALSRLRQGIVLTAPLPDAGGGTDGALVAEPAEARPDGEELRAGSLRITPEQVERLEASGNYVVVHLATGRHLVAGPFGDVSARMPSRLGLRVHRSHWVARRVIGRLVRSGRDMWIVLACGTRVPVGTSLQDGVQDWLGRSGIGVERVPPSKGGR